MTPHDCDRGSGDCGPGDCDGRADESPADARPFLDDDDRNDLHALIKKLGREYRDARDQQSITHSAWIRTALEHRLEALGRWMDLLGRIADTLPDSVARVAEED